MQIPCLSRLVVEARVGTGHLSGNVWFSNNAAIFPNEALHDLMRMCSDRGLHIYVSG